MCVWSHFSRVSYVSCIGKQVLYHQRHLGNPHPAIWLNKGEVLVARLCPTLCDPMDGSPPGSMEFSRQEYWSGLPFPSPGNLPNPGIKPRSPASQADSLPSHQGSPGLNKGLSNSGFLFVCLLCPWLLLLSLCLKNFFKCSLSITAVKMLLKKATIQHNALERNPIDFIVSFKYASAGQNLPI